MHSSALAAFLVAALAVVLPLHASAGLTATTCVAADRNGIGIFKNMVSQHLDTSYCPTNIPDNTVLNPLALINNVPSLNVTIPDAIKPPAEASTVLFSLKAIGVRKYQCLQTAAGVYSWSEQISSACLYRDSPDKLSGYYKKPVGLLVFNPTMAGRAFYGSSYYPQSAFQVLQVSKVAGATSADLSWELAQGITHLYEPLIYPTYFDFRQALYHNRVLTSGGAAPTTTCTADKVGTKVNQEFSAWIIFYGASTFTCPLL